MLRDDKNNIISREELRARAAELSLVPPAGKKGLDTALLVLKTGSDWYGLPALLVQEIAADPAVAQLPLTPEFVAGVMNLRGELIGAIDLASLFGLPRPAGPLCAAVVRSGAAVFALLAEKALGVEHFASADREPVVPTLHGEAARYFDGAFRADSRIITEINIDRILDCPRLKSFCGAGEPEV